MSILLDKINYVMESGDKDFIKDIIDINDYLSVLVKYSGNIYRDIGDFTIIEIILDGYAIITVKYFELFRLFRATTIIEVEEEFIQFYLEQREDDIKATQQIQQCYKTSEYDGSGTIVGIIDSGIAYNHPEFLNEDGTTRIKYILDFSEEGSQVNGFNYGEVYTEQQINTALETGVPIPHKDINGHGTSVASIACGNSSLSNKSDIIAIKLSNKKYKSFEVLRGLRFLRVISENLNKPVAVNLSLGSNDTSHAGDSLMEQVINEYQNLNGFALCIASGNENFAGHHIKIDEPGRYVFIASTKEFFLNVFVYKGENIRYRLYFEDGTFSQYYSSDKSIYVEENDLVRYIVGYESKDNNIYDMYKFKFILKNRDFTRIVVDFSEQEINEPVHMYLPTLESVSDYTYFLRSTQLNTLTFPSTAKDAITVGGVDLISQIIAPFSGTGYNLAGDVKPNVVAPSVKVRCADTFGNYVFKTGTSFASPLVASICSVLQEENPQIKGVEIKAILERDAREIGGFNHPNFEFGYGLACLQKDDSSTKQNDIQFLVDDDLENIIFDKYEYSGEVLGLKIFNVSINDIDAFTNDMYKNNIKFEKSKMLSLASKDTLDSIGATSLINDCNLTGENVLVGMIDIGIDYNSPVYMKNGTSRVRGIYDIKNNVTYDKNSLDNNEYEITNNDLNGHGMRITSVACGNEIDGFSGVAYDTEILMAVISDTNKDNKESSYIDSQRVAYSSIDVLKGLEYLVQEAKNLCKPISIGIPFSTNEGGRYGDTLFEQAIDSVCENEGVCVCVPTGNNGNSKKYSILRIIKNEPNFIFFNCSESSVKIVSTALVPQGYSMELLSPQGERHFFDFATSKCIENKFFDYNINVNFKRDENTHIEICLNGFIKGVWRISYIPKRINDNIDIYLPIFEQSSLDTRFFSSVSDNTLTIPSSSKKVIAVGGLNEKTDSEFLLSGNGGFYIKKRLPDVIASSVIVPCYTKMGVTTGTGTSFAMSYAVGMAALLLQYDNKMNTSDIKTLFRNNAVRLENTPYPNQLEGYGRLRVVAEDLK